MSARWRKSVLFTIGAAAIFLRCPRLFFEPRFWAEEGSFFSFAFSHSALETLLRPDGGNYDLPRNLASVLAVHLAPLEWAPLVTTLFSFGIKSHKTGLDIDSHTAGKFKMFGMEFSSIYFSHIISILPFYNFLKSQWLE